MALPFINEFHYDNSSTDAGEFIEIAGLAGTDLSGYSLVLYNGNPTQLTFYATINLSGVISNSSNGYGVLSFAAVGLQNGGSGAAGEPDGIALVGPSGVIEFVSYEGAFTAANGPAAGMTSTNVGAGIFEPGTVNGTSIARTGSGDDSIDFTWVVDSNDTPGAINNGETFFVGGTTVFIDDVTIAEGDSGSTLFTFTVTRSDASGAFTFDFDTADGTATTADSDYDATSGTLDFTAGGAATQTISVTINGDTDGEPSETFTVVLSNLVNSSGTAALSDDTGLGTISNDDIAVTFIHDVQGAGDASAYLAQDVTIEAIVVGDFQNGDLDNTRNLNGFYLQEEPGDFDANPLSSEGLFVFTGTTDVGLGDKVIVTGTVTEFFGITEITAISIAVVTADAVADVHTMAVDVDLPSAGVTLNQNGQYQPDLEAYEGMLVHFTDTMTISEQFNLDRFNEIRLVAGDRPVQYTQENEPGQAGYAAHLQEVGSRTITYDDGLFTQNAAIGNLDGFDPYNTASAPRMGDTVVDLIGVLDYQWAGQSASGSTWRVRSIEDGDNVFTSANPRPADVPDVGGTLKVGSFNVLNYFKSLDDGSLTANGSEPRGANDAAEFTRQTEKLLSTLIELDADVLGLTELENDFLAGSSGNALEFLVNQLNAELGAGTYAWVDPGTQFIGGDAIAVGYIYKPGVVHIAAGTSVEILDDSDLPGLGLSNLMAQSTVGGVFNGVNTSRPPVAVTFEENATGEKFTAVVNHFKSKSGTGTGADADQLDGQGNWQQQRELAAEALTAWIATDPTGSGDSDILILGDLNSYFREDSIDIFAAAGFENLQETQLTDPYSYVFDGRVGALDYILAGDSMADQVTGITEWHINADEADALDYNLDFGRDAAIFDEEIAARVSDHDPVLIGLELETDDAVYTLQLLHFSDAEAGLLASQIAPNLAALVDAFEDDYANSFTIASGDLFLPGPFMAAGTDPSLSSLVPGNSNPGRVDISIMNAIGVHLSAIGNHEFDLGSNVFGAAITPGGGYAGALFPYLSANLDFSGDSALNPRFTNTVGVGGLEEASTLNGRIVPSAVITEGGEQIGFVGATTQVLESISSPSGTEVKGFPGGPGPNGEINDIDLLAAQLQPVIDDLINQGVNKIVLVSHLQQIELEQELATKLSGVDIIIAGGSNTRLGDADDEAVAFPGHSDVFEGDYPIVTTDLDGNTTLIVNTDSEFTYLGRLVVDFDVNGEIVLDSITENLAVNGAYASTAENVAEAWGVDVADLPTTAFAPGTRGDAVKDLTDAVQNVITVKDGVIFGYSDVYLEGERSQVRSQETNLGDVSADANADAARDALGLTNDHAIVSIKNGGGIRAQIGTIIDDGTGNIIKVPPEVGGEVSQLDVENALRFNNKLMVFDTTAQGLLNILNSPNAVNAGNGGFIQIGGVRFSYDPTKPAGSRVQDVVLINAYDEITAVIADNGVVNPGAPAVISVVALNFTANGGDGYLVKANADNFRFILADGTLSAPVSEALDFTAAGVVPANALGEIDAFARYFEERYGTPETAYNEADTPQTLDTRIQNQAVRTDTVLQGEYVTLGSASNDVMNGTSGPDKLKGLAGNDKLNGNSGDDVLIGGLGSDTLNGGAGSDTASYENAASGVAVSLLNGQGSFGEASGDQLKSIENLTGSAFDDVLIGDTKANVIHGGAGNDIIEGKSGADHLFGDDGDDMVRGGMGIDQLSGGAGADSFVFLKNETGKTNALADAITDFLASEGDRIDLSGIDANTANGSSDDTFAFIGNSAFSHTAGELRYDFIGSDLYVSGDVNGDGRADLVIHLLGVGSVAGTDFML